MRKGLISTFGLTLALVCPIGAMGQSLADVARAEEARRKSIKQPATKVYTNDDLTRAGDSPTVRPAAATPAPARATPAAGVKAAEVNKEATPATPPASVKDEKYWRERLTSARTALDRSQAFFDALQSQINGLNTEFVNVDDPAQRTVIEQKRQRAVAEQNRVKAEIAQQTKAIADIQDEARRASVPPGWLR